MVEHPENQIAAFAKAGADIITFHAEVAKHPHRIIQEIKSYGKKAGIALNPGSSLKTIEELLPDLDMVLLMTVNPGFGGQNFIPNVLGKIEQLRRIVKEKQFALDIQVDGGINSKTAKLVITAGANVLVAGSAIYNATNIISAIKDLRE